MAVVVVVVVCRDIIATMRRTFEKGKEEEGRTHTLSLHSKHETVVVASSTAVNTKTSAGLKKLAVSILVLH